jgi:hypothetical protein
MFFDGDFSRLEIPLGNPTRMTGIGSLTMSYFTRIKSTWCQIKGLRRKYSPQFMIHL